MSEPCALVCFLDQAAAWVDRHRNEEDIVCLASRGGYSSCLLCFAHMDGRLGWMEMAERLRGISEIRLIPVDFTPEYAYDQAHEESRRKSIFLKALGSCVEYDILLSGVAPSYREGLIHAGRSGQLRGHWLCRGGDGEILRQPMASVEGLRQVADPFSESRARVDCSASDRRSWRDFSAVCEGWALGAGRGHCEAGAADFEALIRRMAKYDDVGILIQGETGTGKTRLARRIHAEGPRSSGPLIEMNCSCIPSGMVESELFGHVRGAYTGADSERMGKIRAAHGGVLFLDEIGELGLDVQARLLKVLEDRLVTPLGSEKPLAVDIRFIAATNKDLRVMVGAGTFRFDLFNRLNQFCVLIPPLRERKEEIRPLAEGALREWVEDHGEEKAFSEGALRAMEASPWPGNVRELIQTVRSACVRCPGAVIDAMHLFLEKSAFPMAGADKRLPVIPEGGIILRDVMVDQEWAYYRSALLKSGGRPEKAARLLGLSAHTFRKALRERYAPRMREFLLDLEGSGL